jgi:hypothetical protein
MRDRQEPYLLDSSCQIELFHGRRDAVDLGLQESAKLFRLVGNDRRAHLGETLARFRLRKIGTGDRLGRKEPMSTSLRVMKSLALLLTPIAIVPITAAATGPKNRCCLAPTPALASSARQLFRNEIMRSSLLVLLCCLFSVGVSAQIVEPKDLLKRELPKSKGKQANTVQSQVAKDLKKKDSKRSKEFDAKQKKIAQDTTAGRDACLANKDACPKTSDKAFKAMDAYKSK